MRKLAFKVLYEYYTYDTFLNLALKNIDSEKIENFNQVTIRVYGIVQNDIYLNFIVDQLTQRKKLDVKTHIILKMAIFEKLFLNSIPDYAIISDYTKLVKKVNRKSLNYVSYFLNAYINDLEYIEPIYSNEMKNIAIKYSTQQWIVKLLAKQYPKDYINIIADTTNKKQTFVRALDDVKLSDKYNKSHFDDLYTYNGNVTKSEYFIENKVLVQDLGSYLITKYLNPQKSETILDLCAAPGNKTMHIANNAKLVVANEINITRSKLITTNCEKYNINNVNVINNDATCQNELDNDIQGLIFDKILVDAPCSGLGVLKSKPEIKNKLTNAQIDLLLSTQLKILLTAEKYLKEGGYILYSTCTLNKKENEEQVEEFLSKAIHKYEFIPSSIISSFAIESDKIGYTLFPQTQNSDGFYMCLLRRI